MNQFKLGEGTTAGLGRYSGTYAELEEDEVGDLPKKGGVMFKDSSSMEDVKRISRISTYDSDEIRNYWGSSTDNVMRRSELKNSLRDMVFKHRTSDSDFTTLGIDDKAGPGKLVKKANRKMAWDAVLDEQDLQQHEGVSNEKMISAVYAYTTDAARREARQKAERLEQELSEEMKK